MAELTERVGRNAGNSNLPPFSDGPSGRKNKSPKGKRRGGQSEHRGSRRTLVDAGRVDDFVDFYPSHCERCCGVLPQYTAITFEYGHDYRDGKLTRAELRA